MSFPTIFLITPQKNLQLFYKNRHLISRYSPSSLSSPSPSSSSLSSPPLPPSTAFPFPFHADLPPPPPPPPDPPNQTQIGPAIVFRLAHAFQLAFPTQPLLSTLKHLAHQLKACLSW